MIVNKALMHNDFDAALRALKQARQELDEPEVDESKDSKFWQREIKRINESFGHFSGEVFEIENLWAQGEIAEAAMRLTQLRHSLRFRIYPWERYQMWLATFRSQVEIPEPLGEGIV
jgi:hypothetical protein